MVSVGQTRKNPIMTAMWQKPTHFLGLSTFTVVDAVDPKVTTESREA